MKTFRFAYFYFLLENVPVMHRSTLRHCFLINMLLAMMIK